MDGSRCLALRYEFPPRLGVLPTRWVDSNKVYRGIKSRSINTRIVGRAVRLGITVNVRMQAIRSLCLFFVCAICGTAGLADDNNPQRKKESTQEPQINESRAAIGLENLLNRPYLPPDFDDEVFDQLWTVWEEPLRSRAASASQKERRELAFERYGLNLLPGSGRDLPMQYTRGADQGWVMNCLACHGGEVAGQVIPGLPNSHFDMQTLTEEVVQVKKNLGKPASHLDLGILKMPLSGSVGTTNAVMFGVTLMSLREKDLTVRLLPRVPKLMHHDMDAPPLWNVKHKSRLYADGFAPKSHRALMQFLLVLQNGPDEFQEWESEYADVLAWIESVQPPKYPFTVKAEDARRGNLIFTQHCDRCHGTYEGDRAYPELCVPLRKVKTDPVRLTALNAAARHHYGESWFNQFDPDSVIDDPAGYVAPPLDGIWASAPYLHNGSVPTLWHVLRSKSRPVVWRRLGNEYDEIKVGFPIESLSDLPGGLSGNWARRRYFDSRIPGKSAQGHDFGDALSDEEVTDLIEYLKTL